MMQIENDLLSHASYIFVTNHFDFLWAYKIISAF